MGIYVYVTERCQEDAQRHALKDELARVREQVEAQQSLSYFNRFPAPYLVKKKLGGRNPRLVAREVLSGEHRVLVLLAILIRGDTDYQRFAKDPVRFGQQQFDEALDNLDLDAYLAERTQLDPVPGLPDPSPGEYEALYASFAHRHELGPDEIVYDSHRWVERVHQELVANQLNRVLAACAKALGAEAGVGNLPVPERAGWRVWFWRGRGHLVLLDITTAGAVAPEWLANSPFSQDAAWGDPHLQQCRRAYPSLLLAAEDLWVEIEKEPLGNMALSPEETAVLEAVRDTAHGSFPLFINGRAGSGKSTLLQYLFADLLFFHLRESAYEPLSPPLYLTASLDLLETAKGLVERLLRSDAGLCVLEAEAARIDLPEVLQHAFQPFRRFALNLLPPERRERFSGDGYIDYSTFRRLWQERYRNVPEAREHYGADLCWHVIRSYIKGQNAEAYLEPDDYQHLPAHRKSVSDADFALVYERVWVPWYQPLTDVEAAGAWDDQDLSRTILNGEHVPAIYPAIVCDEAQDFTSIELDLILRCNLFSARAIPAHDIPRVPFAFAGDPFQTLNPTGFRWDAIKSAFHECFIDGQNRAGQAAQLSLSYHELQYNYRSTGSIVRFGNWVQALRVALLGDTEAQPQMPWLDDRDAAMVVWYSADDPNFWQAFEEQTEFVVIVPCGEGQEAEYVQQDPILSQHIAFDNGVPLRVLSPSRAKGCEYPAVLVYGFGSDAPIDVATALAAPAGDDRDSDQLPLQYFLNRLYVAVSRAKRRLVVVDTDAGLQRLWAVRNPVSLEAAMRHRIGPAADRWASATYALTAGIPRQLGSDVAGDPQEHARSFESEGDRLQDSYLFRQAAAHYRRAGNDAKLHECNAKALEADGRYREAAADYLKSRCEGEAIRCLWLAGPAGWSDLTAQGFPPHLPHPDERLWALTICVGASNKAVTELVEKLAIQVQEGRLRDEPVWYRTWSAALAALLTDRCVVGQIDDPALVQRLANAFDRLTTGRVKLPDAAAGAIYYDAERYPEALRHWERLHVKDRPAAYQVALAQTTSYPASLAAWQKCERPDRVLECFRANPGVELGEADAARVMEPLLAEGEQLGQAYRLAWNTSGVKALVRLLRYLVEHDRIEAEKVLEAIVFRLVELPRWDLLLPAIQPRGSLLPPKDWQAGAATSWMQNQRITVQTALVRALARSDEFAVLDNAQIQEFGNFLNSHLRVNEAERWTRYVSIPEAGAAIERAGRFVDALSFYDAVLKDDHLAEHHQLARERYCVAKRRQVDHETRHGTDARRIQRLEREWRHLAEEFSLAERDAFPEYPKLPRLVHPALPSLDPPEPPGEVSPFDGTRLEPQWLPRRGRLNLRHLDTGDSIAVRLSERDCRGDVDLDSPAPNQWSCAEWDLLIELIEVDGQPTGVAVTLAGRRAEYHLADETSGPT